MLRAKQEYGRNRILLECRAERGGSALAEEETEKGEDVSRATLIWRAIKLPMYTVGLVPASVSPCSFTVLFADVLYSKVKLSANLLYSKNR